MTTNATRAREIAIGIVERAKNKHVGQAELYFPIECSLIDLITEAISTPTPVPQRTAQCASPSPLLESSSSSALPSLQKIYSTHRGQMNSDTPAPVAGDDETAQRIVNDKRFRYEYSPYPDRVWIAEAIASALSAARSEAVRPFVEVLQAIEAGFPRYYHGNASPLWHNKVRQLLGKENP